MVESASGGRAKVAYGRRGKLLRGLTAIAVLLSAGPGCTRKFFRQRADEDVTGVLTQKNVFPAWKIENWHVYPDPRARFADLSRPDRPTFPPDDYAAYRLSPNPQQPTKKAGVGRVDGDGYLCVLSGWDAENRTRLAAAGELQSPSAPAVPSVEPLPPPKAVSPANDDPLTKLLGPTTREPNLASRSSAATKGPVAPAGMAVLPAPLDLSKLPPPRIEMTVSPAAPAPPKDQRRSKDPASPPNAVVPAGARAEGAGAMGVVPAGGPTVPTKAALPLDRLPDPIPPSPPGPAGPAVPAPAAEPQPLKPLAPQPLVPPVPAPLPPATAEPSPTDIAAKPDDYTKALFNDEKGYRLRLEQAVELGVFNSREFQDQRENLYNAALPVTLQRFSFAAQAFATETAVRTSLGRDVPGGPLQQWQLTGTAGFSRLFPTGATLLATIANQFVINLGSGTPYTSVSTFSLTLAQPFLRGGGFAVTLEPLTLAERNLLYAIRSFARYRKLFYVAIAAGGGYTNNPYGLSGLSVNLGRGIGNNLTAPSAGFIPTILRDAANNNTKKNIESLTQLLKLYQAFREGGQQSDLQVSQVEQQLIGVQSSLLGPNGPVGVGGGASGGGTGGATSGGIRGYLDNLDNFKLQLGLPVTVPLELDDGPLRPIRRQLARFEAVYSDIQAVEGEARKYDPAEPVARFRPRWRNLLTESRLTRGTRFADAIRDRWSGWERLTDDELTRRLARLGEERRKLLDLKADRDVKGQPDVPEEALRSTVTNAEIDLGQFERTLRRYEAEPWARDRGPGRATAQAAAFRDVFNSFYQLILEARNDRLARIRERWPKLPPLSVDGKDLLVGPLDEAYTSGIQTALTNRLDLMNTRGQVVDQWRQIKVTSNALLGVLNVQYNLSGTTPPTNADVTGFAANRTTQTLTINGALPLVRRAERNAYRSAIIAYQASRRTLMAFEDNIANDVRGDIRELRVIAEQYRMQQRLIELGYSLVDNAQEILIAPPAPGSQTDAGSAAALTQQVLLAQSGLLAAQNNLYVIWVNYVVSRMQFYLDLELMALDPRGLWIDDFSPSDGDDDSPRPALERPPVGERLAEPHAAGR